MSVPHLRHWWKPAGFLETGACTASGCYGNRGTWRVQRTQMSLPLPWFQSSWIDMSAQPKGKAEREETFPTCMLHRLCEAKHVTIPTELFPQEIEIRRDIFLERHSLSVWDKYTDNVDKTGKWKLIPSPFYKSKSVSPEWMLVSKAHVVVSHNDKTRCLFLTKALWVTLVISAASWAKEGWSQYLRGGSRWRRTWQEKQGITQQRGRTPQTLPDDPGLSVKCIDRSARVHRCNENPEKRTPCLYDLFNHHFHVGFKEGGRRAGILSSCIWVSKQTSASVKYRNV